MADTAATVELKTVLKESILNERTLIVNKKLSSSPKTDPAAFSSLLVKAMDSTATDISAFKYHIVDTLFSKPGLSILLIGREYESENIIWLAVYDGQHKLVDHKTVYYDNAEGFLSVETVIKNNQVTITTINEYAEDEKEKKTTGVFYLNEKNKLVKQ